MDFTIGPLGPATWEAFEALAARHGGVWGGCWCLAFHPEGGHRWADPDGRRAAKRARVEAGEAHAALVFEGDSCVGWCQYGPPAELARIRHRKAWEAGGGAAPDWRITCFFVDKGARGRGGAEAALAGALSLIAAAGGGVVEAMPEEVAGRKTSASFLWGGEAGMFDRAGFQRVRKLGKHVWLVRKTVVAAGPA
ncbi:MAG: GNAT family N-acetyltransferase [Paracoccaceae bacterium]